jgi:hypothetical protein
MQPARVSLCLCRSEDLRECGCGAGVRRRHLAYSAHAAVRSGRELRGIQDLPCRDRLTGRQPHEERAGKLPDSDEVGRLAALIRDKNEVERKIAALIGRPATPGNIGEFVAAKVFGTSLMTSGSHPG